MSRRLLTFGFCCVVFFSASSQNKIELAAGLNVNFVRFGEFPNGSRITSSASMGYHIGAFAPLRLGKKIQLAPGLQYSLKGCDDYSEDGIKLKLHYIEVPVLLSWRFLKRVGVELGPTLALSIGSYTKGGDIKQKFDIRDTDFGLNAGGSFALTEKITLYGRYFHGFTSFDYITFRDDQNVVIQRTPQYNRTVQIGLRYALKRQSE